MGVDPGSLVSFPVLVTNTGNGDDEVTLSLVGGSRWSTYLEPSLLMLPHNSTLQASVAARAPVLAPANDSLELQVLGASVLQPSARSNLTLTAVVNRLGKFVLEIEPDRLYADPGTTAQFNVAVTNIGNAPERVLLDVPSPARLSLGELEVRPGEKGCLTLSYTVANGERAWAEHYIELSGVSAYNSSMGDSARTVVVVNQLHRLSGELSPDRLALLPGEQGNVSLLVRNEGNGPEVALVLVDGHPPGWKAEAEPPLANLEPRRALQGQLLLGVPPRTPAGPYNLTVNITDGTGASILLPLEVEVLRVHDFTASVRPAVRSAAPGKRAVFTLVLENLGNSPEQVRLVPNGSRASWVSPALKLAMLGLYGGNETELWVRSRPDAAPGKYNLSLLAIGEDNATCQLFFTLVVREASVSTGDLPCLVAALLMALASAAVYLARKRARRAAERLRPEGADEAAGGDDGDGAEAGEPSTGAPAGEREWPGTPHGESPLIQREP